MSFSRLLEKTRPSTTPLQGGKLPDSHRPRLVQDLASWLEAWNIYLLVRVAYDPSFAPELIRYQSIICTLFASVEVSSCLAYDRLFRHQAAKDPTLRWDNLKEDIFVFQTYNATSTRKQPFRRDIFNRLGPQPDQRADHESHAPSGAELCRRFNYAKCTLGVNCRYAHVCWVKGCGGSHPAKGCSFKQPS